ncbi:MAG: hypothetical protein BZY75_03500 [SAR202 cluster bacterium Io17-Chloro-G7]|nr:MAG: hypothetical protein BZY75_03500 [SAR202 cluster bacterium Io17-Chloro-G7]
MESTSGKDLHRAFVAAAACLERYRDAINALNVFPVPDGDTGTNMLLTLRSALEQCPKDSDNSAEEVLAGLAEGAFWGARGNSGVILSQLFRGLSEACRGHPDGGSPWLTLGLRLATDAAYKSVVNPVEGTMLTVISAASTAASTAVRNAAQMAKGGGEGEASGLWQSAFQGAVEAVYATPSQLPILREAGVVDAGGMGVALILGASFCSLAGQDPALVDQALGKCCVEPLDPIAAQRRVDQELFDHRATSGSSVDSWPGSNHDSTPSSNLKENWGYCIQYVINTLSSGHVADSEGGSNSETGVTTEIVRAGLGPEMGGSTVIVGDGRYVKVHVHAFDPGPALSYGASLGQLDRISIENMSLQSAGLVPDYEASTTLTTNISVVAVVRGEGLRRLFQDAGCSGIIDGGQSMNPNVGQFLEQSKSRPDAQVIILPNNANVLAAATQAAIREPHLHVVPSKSVPQGVAALLAYSPEEPLAHNLEAMSAVLSGVISMEVTQAARSTIIRGIPVRAGQYIGIIEGELASCAETPEAVLESILGQTVNSPDQVVTIYHGADALTESSSESSTNAIQGLRSTLEFGFPGIQVDVVDGGQPNYHYLASVE